MSQLSHASTDSTSKLVSHDRRVEELEGRVRELETRLSSKDEEWREVLADREEALNVEWEGKAKDLKAQLTQVGLDVCVWGGGVEQLVCGWGRVVQLQLWQAEVGN